MAVSSPQQTQTSATTAKVWRYRGVENPAIEPDFLAACDGSRLLAGLLKNRGIETTEAAKRFLNLEDYQPTSGDELPNMQAGLDRMITAIDGGQNILVYGDFDVDGQTGTSILFSALKHLNANVSFYIPDRVTEGHGMNPTALCRLVSSRRVNLVITTDTGITDFKEVALLTGIGVDCIVTDHHDLPENLPLSVANINPKLLGDKNHPLYEMCGAGVAFKFCELLLAHYNEAPYAETLYDIAAIGTVVDMMPLINENRWLVWRGLKTLNLKNRPGLNALLEEAGTAPESTITSQTIGFTLGPRLNALGRLDRADEGVELLTTQDEERARHLAAKFEALNRKRKAMCEETEQEAIQFMARQGGGANGGLGDQRAVIMASPGWHPGIVGLVGTRLKDRYNVPIFMMVIDEDNKIAKCSARSIEGFHLHDELVKLEHYFLNFGGHAGAAGFALPLEKLESFKRDLHQLCASVITDEMMRPIVDIDARVDWHQLTPGLIELLDKLEPTGQANPGVLLSATRLKLSAQRFLGEEKKHLKLLLNDPERSKAGEAVEAIIWNHRSNKLAEGIPIDIAFRPELNRYKGSEKLQLIVEEIASEAGSLYQSTREVETPSSQFSPQAIKPVRPNSGNKPSLLANSSEPLVSWIDHRSREGLATFTGQLLVPLQNNSVEKDIKSDTKKVLFYNEGAEPLIPFLNNDIMVNRDSIQPCEELVLWDFPPTQEALKAILDAAEAKTIHFMGGQCQQNPVFLPSRDWLKQIYQAIRKPTETTINLKALAIQLSTTTMVIQSGLSLLAAMSLIQTSMVAGSNGESVIITPLNSNGEKREITDYNEYWLFEHHIKAISTFRDWLLKTPIDAIKSRFA